MSRVLDRNLERGSDRERGAGPQRPRMLHETQVTSWDKPLFAITLTLMLVGLFAVFSASAHQALRESGNSWSYFLKQLLAAVAGLALMTGISRINYQVWRRWSMPFAFFSVALLVATMFVGTTANGSERWLPLPFGFQFQPSDLAKLAAIGLIAEATATQKFFTPLLFRNMAMVLVMVGLIYQQPNLSVSMILMALSGMMLFVAGVPWQLFAIGIPVVGYGIYQKILQTPYQLRRIQGWLHPWDDPQDTGYNLIQSLYAIGSGGLFGVGFGHSVQKMYYLPFQHTDFIFSVICEELGFFGALLIIGLFAALAYRGFSIAFSCPSRFGQMMAFGITAAITLQAAINISVTTGLMPVTGVTLPLISYGGTSMMITLAMIGILLSVSRYKLTIRLTEPEQESRGYF
jgi:cell division protein FtsW